MKFSETIIIGLAMKRSYKSGSSKPFYKNQKEKQLNEILDKTRALDKLWTPMVMTHSYTTQSSGSSTVDEYSKESLSSDAEMEKSTASKMTHIGCFDKCMDLSPRSEQFSTTNRSHHNVFVIRKLHCIPFLHALVKRKQKNMFGIIHFCALYRLE